MADIRSVKDPVRRTFDLLAASSNASAVRVLIGALEEPIPEIQCQAVSALLRRRHKVGLRALIRAYHVLGSARDLLIEQFDVLIPALRETVRDSWPQARRNAVELICRGGGPRLGHLLGQLLNDPSAEVAEQAASGLLAWTRDIAEEWRASRDVAGAHRELTAPRNALLATLWEAFRVAEGARCRPVLLALIHLDRGQLANVLRQIRDPGDPRLAALPELLRASDDPQIVVFTYVLLGDPRLSPDALRLIGERGDAAFVHALLDGADALEKEAVRSQLRRLTDVTWLDPANPDLAALSIDRLEALVRFVAATGLPPSAQAEFLCRLTGRLSAQGRLVIVESVRGLSDDLRRPVVRAALLDEDECVQLAATEQVVDSQWSNRDRLLVGRLASPFEPVRHAAIRELSRYSFQRYLDAFEHLDPKTRELAGRAVRRIDKAMPERLTDELHALDPKRRFKALKVLQTLGLEEELADHLGRLMNDTDRVIRATVVKVLGVVRTLEATQGILSALNDADPRVQANAVEVLADHNSEAFVGLLEPFLRHPNSRVRANAARGLVRLQYLPARDCLLDMLEEPSERMRLSAVWALSHLLLPEAVAPLERLAREDPSPRVRARARDAVEVLKVRTGVAG